MKTKQTTILIGLSILGFISMLAGLALFIMTSDYLSLILVVFGIILSVVIFIKSLQKERHVSTNTFEEEETFEQPAKLVLKKDMIAAKEDEDEERIVEPMIPSPNLDRHSFVIKIDNSKADALVSLMEKMEEVNLVVENQDFYLNNTSNDVIFKTIYKPIPVVVLVKNRTNNYNILAGLSNTELLTIGVIDDADLQRVQEVYPKSQNIQGLIEGGKYKNSDDSIHDQAHRVTLTFFT